MQMDVISSFILLWICHFTKVMLDIMNVQSVGVVTNFFQVQRNIRRRVVEKRNRLRFLRQSGPMMMTSVMHPLLAVVEWKVLGTPIITILWMMMVFRVHII